MVDLTNDFKQYMADDYLKHEVFLVLKDFINFYEHLSQNVFLFMSQGISGTGIFNIDSYIYYGTGGTLDSIRLVLEKGRINDAFALTRKYHDAVVMDIFKAFLIQEKYNPLDNKWTVKQIDEWAHSKGKMPKYEAMMKYIHRVSKNHGDPRDHFSVDRYTRIRNKCNNHQHHNSLSIMMFNDNAIHNDNRIKELGQLSICIKDIFTLHFAYFFHLHPAYMSSSDYREYMDVGETPPEGCQNWVAPFIQTTFDKYIKTRMPQLASYIRESSCMELA